MRSVITTTFFIIFSGMSLFGQERLPIIDMHLHSHEAWIPTSTDSSWIPLYLSMPDTDESLLRETMAALEKFNIVKAVTSGNRETVVRWRAFDAERIIPALKLNDLPQDSAFLDELRSQVLDGEVSVLGELQPQYLGYGPDDKRFEPYFALAEELDVPMGIHMGLGPEGGVVACCPNYRIRAGDPLLLEDALARHPNLRIYVMHAGWPMIDNMVALLHSYPQVYVDLGVINWYIPRAEFHTYLRRLVEAGFDDRIMFGSDQMNWPGAIELAIEGVESAKFLSKEQKRNIFYNNAADFLQLSKEEIKLHHIIED